MDCILTREQFRADGIFGEIVGEGGWRAATLEHSYPTITEDIAGTYEPKITAGVYECARYFSPRHGYEVFRLTNTPGSTFDEIHVGNFQADSEGCILLGFQYILFPKISRSMVSFSKDTFDAFMKMQEGTDRFTLTIKDQE